MIQGERLPSFIWLRRCGAIVFAGIVVGLLIGFVWEYLREHKHRRALSKTGREVNKLEREVKRLKGRSGDGKDDVLALIE
mgnify:CR=1 FL=1